MQELEHSAKGTTWRNHKYTAIQMVNGKKRYIYNTLTKAGTNLSWDLKAARAKAVLAAQNKIKMDKYKESIKKQKKEKQMASITRKRGNPERTVKKTATTILTQQQKEAAARKATYEAFNKRVSGGKLPGVQLRKALRKVSKNLLN